MRILLVVMGLAAVVAAAYADYSAAPVTTPVWLGGPATNASAPPRWIPKQPGHYTKTDWQHVIDSTWGPGLPLNEKLAVFDSFWSTMDDSFACFNNLTVNWDSLRTVYRSEIAGNVSCGRFAAIMSHLAMALREAHTSVDDYGVNFASLLPGVPLWVVGAWMDVGHFGAALTPLPDSSLLVYRVAKNHPLGLRPGDVVLGYDRRPWTEILRELQDAQLPIQHLYCWGSCSTAMTYSLLNAAGMNWHLFDTIDIMKYATGQTMHLPTSLLAGQHMHLFATDQLDVPGVPMPAADSTLSVTYGIVSGTHVGYIYAWRWYPSSAAEFYNAVKALVSDTTLWGIILDFRYNEGGGIPPSDSGLSLLFCDSTPTICFTHRRDPGNHTAMAVVRPASDYAIPGNGVGYDKPIAVLVGPGAVSAGDQVAYRLTYHPRVKTFGRSTNAAFTSKSDLNMPAGWHASYAMGEACLASDTTHFLTHQEFPVDVPVWQTREAVARGEDAVVEAAINWIVSTSGVDDSTLGATIVRGVLMFGVSEGPWARGELFEITGRKVMNLSSGANDVSRLSSGVYFLREMQAQVRSVRKIVVAR